MKCTEGRVELPGRCKEGVSQSHGSSDAAMAWQHCPKLGRGNQTFTCHVDQPLGVGGPSEGDMTEEGKFQRGAQL